MELLSDFGAGDDPVSEVLRTLRVRSTVYCRSEMRAPWGFGVEAHGNPAFHLVASGSCWLELDGQDEHRHLVGGDLVVLPGGCRHWARDHPSTPSQELEDILAETPPEQHRRLRYGGHGPRTELLCGGFRLEGGNAHPFLRALPPVIHIRGSAGRPAPWVSATLALLSAEVASDAPGAEAVVVRLTDALLTQALRIGLAEFEARDGARILALRDPEIASAIGLVHRHPERPWTVGGLASEVALSRSAFAARFRQLVGESPRRYIIRSRLAHAATLLHCTDASLAEIARRAGYGNEFSFSKAFRRTFGIAPGAYRGQPEPPGAGLARSTSSGP